MVKLAPMPDAEFQRLTDAANVMEAGAIKELLAAHDIDCFIKGEQHAAMFGAYGAAIGFDIMVRTADLERAAELVAAFHEAEPVDDLEEEAMAAVHADTHGPDFDGDFDALFDADFDALFDGDQPADPRTGMLSVRKAAVLSCVPAFGFGHFYTAAFQRGAMLGLAQLIGIALALSGNPAALAITAAAVAVDAVGASQRAAALNRERQTAGAVFGTLPTARALPRSSPPGPSSDNDE